MVLKQRDVLNAIPHCGQQEVTTELSDIWKLEKKVDALLNLSAFNTKYEKRYPEAIQSLEKHLLTFYVFPPVSIAIFAVMWNVTQR